MGTAVRLVFAMAGGAFALFFTFCPDAGERTAGANVREIPAVTVAATSAANPAPALCADGSKTTVVEAYVTGSRGEASMGVPVLFSSSAGTITPCAWTDSGGKVSVPYSPIYSAVDTSIAITAMIPDENDSILLVGLFERPANAAPRWDDARIAFLRTGGPETSPIVEEDLVQLATAATGRRDKIVETAHGVSVLVESSENAIPADGVSRAPLRATIREGKSGRPIAGVEVVFCDSRGKVLASTISDRNGIALRYVTSPRAPGRMAVEATVGGTVAATTELVFSPARFKLESAPRELNADGVSRGEVVASVLSDSGDPLPWVPVWFRTTDGLITSPVITGDDGRAVARLTSGTAARTARITAGFSEEPGDTSYVRFTRSFLPASISLSAEPNEIPADRETASLVKAAIFDSTGHPAQDGTPVLFRVVRGEGRVDPFATTAGGIATVRFRSAAPSPAPAVVRAIACGSTEETEVTVRAGRVSLVQVSSEASRIAGDGKESSPITASLYDGGGYPLGAGEKIRFSASRGTIAPSAVTDAEGTARVSYTADVGAGAAWITAVAGDRDRESEGRVSVMLKAGPPAAIVVDAVSADEINVQGSAPPGSATFIFTVVDANGVGVDTSGRSTVFFDLVESPGAGERLLSSSSVTDRSGRVITSIESGRAPGRVKVVASVETERGTIRSEPVEVRIGGFHPLPDRIELEPTRLNLPGLCFTERELPITALVFDQLGNPVPEGTTVYFSSDFGSVLSSAETDALGRATTRFVSSRPHPVSTRGFVSLTATTLTSGETVSASSSILLSGCTRPIRTDPATFAIADGGSQLFTYRVCDANGNPLAPGTSVDVVTNAGTLAGDLAFEVPDALSGHTDFTFYLADAIPGDEDSPSDAFVTIMVTSPNGDLSTTISGTID